MSKQKYIEGYKEACTLKKKIWVVFFQTLLVKLLLNCDHCCKAGNSAECAQFPTRYRTGYRSATVTERILPDMIFSHLEENGLLTDSPHGFVHSSSCLANLIEFF